MIIFLNFFLFARSLQRARAAWQALTGAGPHRLAFTSVSPRMGWGKGLGRGPRVGGRAVGRIAVAEPRLRNSASARMWDARMLSHPAGRYVRGLSAAIATPAMAAALGGGPHIRHVPGVGFHAGPACDVGARLARSVRRPGGGATGNFFFPFLFFFIFFLIKFHWFFSIFF